MLVATSFWETFFLFLIFLPLALIWGFALLDIFRRDDIGGVHKAVWVVFIIVVPFLGVLVYLIAQHDGMRERQLNQAKAQRQAFDSYVKQTAGGSASEIAKAKELLDAGTITQEEFDSIKAKALA